MAVGPGIQCTHVLASRLLTYQVFLSSKATRAAGQSKRPAASPIGSFYIIVASHFFLLSAKLYVPIPMTEALGYVCYMLPWLCECPFTLFGAFCLCSLYVSSARSNRLIWTAILIIGHNS